MGDEKQMHQDYPVSRVTLFTISINNHFSTKKLQNLKYDNGNSYPINQLCSMRKTTVYVCNMKLLATFPSQFQNDKSHVGNIDYYMSRG